MRKRYIKRYISRMKKTAYVSMVAMRVCTKCMKSVAKTIVPHTAARRLPNIFLINTYITGSISTPKSVPEKRQPKGLMPNSAIPAERMIFPSGGCEIS